MTGDATAAVLPSNNPPTLEQTIFENLTELKALEDAYREKIGKIADEFKPRTCHGHGRRTAHRPARHLRSGPACAGDS
ncbi:MAG TPA: hypothetical protein VGM07_21750 [Stellaceae bacterium]